MSTRFRTYLAASNSHGLRNSKPQQIILIGRRKLSIQIQQSRDPKIVKGAIVLLPGLLGQGEEEVVEGQLEGVGEFEALQLDPVMYREKRRRGGRARVSESHARKRIKGQRKAKSYLLLARDGPAFSPVAGEEQGSVIVLQRVVQLRRSLRP